MPDDTTSLRDLVSEGRNAANAEIDTLPVEEILARMNAEDRTVAEAVAVEIPQIARAVDRIVSAFEAGGRLIYVGAGTSGRLGVLDASECPPTFSVPPGLVVGLIAGGDRALRHSVEDAEDDAGQGAKDLDAVSISARDVVVGIAVSGRTPYVIGALDRASEVGAATVALSCNPGSAIAGIADIAISPVVGPEIVAGSTRLKSGTAQKMVLNMLTTAAMIRSGKTYGNLMVDLVVSNRKLGARAVGIVMDAAGCTEAEARDVLSRAGKKVKTAILMQVTGLSKAEAEATLGAHSGVLRSAIAAATDPNRET